MFLFYYHRIGDRMRTFYIFKMKKEFVSLYQNSPGSLYNVLKHLYYMKRHEMSYGFNLFQQLTEKNILPYDQDRVGWLGALGWDARLFDRDDDPNNPYYSLGISPYATYKSVERGGVDQYDFNIAFNFNDRFYFGVTIGAYDVNYRKSYFYGEDMGKGDD